MSAKYQEKEFLIIIGGLLDSMAGKIYCWHYPCTEH